MSVMTTALSPVALPVQAPQRSIEDVLRKCKECGAEKPLTREFFPASGAHWFLFTCRDCRNATMRANYQPKPRRQGRFLYIHHRAEFNCWSSLIQRCTNPANPGYRLYGGRGIKVCDRWRKSFEAFLSDVGPRPKGLTLDRIDVNGHYEPGNVRWATMTQQARNKRDNHLITAFGETRCLADWAAVRGIHIVTLHSRLMRLGWPPERALSTPSLGRGKTPRFDRALPVKSCWVNFTRRRDR